MLFLHSMSIMQQLVPIYTWHENKIAQKILFSLVGFNTIRPCKRVAQKILR